MKSINKYPQNWREIAHLKAIIRGKKFEIKYFEMKLAKKTISYFEDSEPVTPPPNFASNLLRKERTELLFSRICVR